MDLAKLRELQNARIKRAFRTSLARPIALLRAWHPTIVAAFERYGFEPRVSDASTTQFNISWVGAQPNEYLQRLQPRQVTYTLPGQFNFFRKDNLHQTMKQFFSRNPGTRPFVPYAYILPDDRAEVESLFSEHKDRFYIHKAACAARGEGVALVRTLEEVDLTVESVLQEYCADPLLLGGRKFDLRVYVLVLSVDPLILLAYDDVMVRLASEQYEPPTVENYKNKAMHLTNYAVNRDAAGPYELKMLFEEIDELDVAAKQAVGKAIARAIKQVFAANYQVLCQNAQIAGANQLPRKCFGFYGFDFLVNRDLSVTLLEINISPSSRVDGRVDMAIKPPMYDTLVGLVAPEVEHAGEQLLVPIMAEEDGGRLVREFLPKTVSQSAQKLAEAIEAGETTAISLSGYERALIERFFKDVRHKGRFSVLIPEKGRPSEYLARKQSDLLLHMAHNGQLGGQFTV